MSEQHVSETPVDTRVRVQGQPVDSYPQWAPEAARGRTLRVTVVGEDVLHRRNAEVTEFGTPELRALVDDMFRTMYVAEGVGLAANQVGVDLRLFVYDCPDEEARVMRRGHVLDPVLETSERPEVMPHPDDDQEGCLSVPGENFPTGRAEWARVTGTDLDGNRVEIEGKGYFARCLQHETDHLDGYIYLDRLVGRHARAAKKMLKANKWGVPGNSWLPGAED